MRINYKRVCSIDQLISESIKNEYKYFWLNGLLIYNEKRSLSSLIDYESNEKSSIILPELLISVTSFDNPHGRNYITCKMVKPIRYSSHIEMVFDEAAKIKQKVRDSKTYVTFQ